MISRVLYQITKVLLGHMYPVYCSYKITKLPKCQEHVNWIKYWVVFGILQAVEWISDEWLLMTRWFPLYYEIKIGFLLALLFPNCKGARLLYDICIRPLLDDAAWNIEDLVAEVKSQFFCKAVNSWTMLAAAVRSETLELTEGWQQEASPDSKDRDGMQLVARHQTGTDCTHRRRRRSRGWRVRLSEELTSGDDYQPAEQDLWKEESAPPKHSVRRNKPPSSADHGPLGNNRLVPAEYGPRGNSHSPPAGYWEKDAQPAAVYGDEEDDLPSHQGRWQKDSAAARYTSWVDSPLPGNLSPEEVRVTRRSRQDLTDEENPSKSPNTRLRARKGSLTPSPLCK